MPPTCFKILLAGLASPATVSATIAATLAKLWGELIWAFWLHYFVKIWTFQLPTISYNFPSHSLSIYLFLLQASLVPMANLQETMGFTMVLPWFSPMLSTFHHCFTTRNPHCPGVPATPAATWWSWLRPLEALWSLGCQSSFPGHQLSWAKP